MLHTYNDWSEFTKCRVPSYIYVNIKDKKNQQLQSEPNYIKKYEQLIQESREINQRGENRREGLNDPTRR
jgi:hypothetical protein